MPTLRYDADYLKNQFRQARTATELGLIEASITLKFLDYSSSLQTGILKPASVDKEIVRKVPYRSKGAYLKTFLLIKPREFFNGLPPQSKQYSLLLSEKQRLEKIIAQDQIDDSKRIKITSLTTISASKNKDKSEKLFLSKLGEEIGLLFQLADDLLDKKGSLSLVGKPVNKDNKKGIDKSYEMTAENILEEATISGYKIISKKVLKEKNGWRTMVLLEYNLI
mgnify:CR=1 FL=1